MIPFLVDVGITDTQLTHIKKIDTLYLDSPFHFHPNCELVYIEEGYGKKVIGDDISSFNEGDVLLMGPDLPHILTNDDDFYRGNKRLRSKAIVVYFSPLILHNLLRPNSLTTLNTLIKKSRRGLEVTGRAREIVGEKILDMAKQEDISQFITFLSVLEILSVSKEIRYLSSDKFVNTYNEKDTGRINAVYRFLMHNFKKDVQLEEVASIAHLAPTAFCRFFKQRTKKTFSGFLNELRIRHACELLNNPELSIAEISSLSGYRNATNFNKFFKEITGSTPSSFRKKL